MLWYFVLQVKPQLDIFRDAVFASFRKTLNAEMKRLKAGGLGVHTKQAEPITPDEEELLWSKNLLGAHSPQPCLILWCIFVECTSLSEV